MKRVSFRDVPKVSDTSSANGKYVDREAYADDAIHVFIWLHKNISNVFWYCCIENGSIEGFNSLKPQKVNYKGMSVFKVVKGEELHYKHSGDKRWRPANYEADDCLGPKEVIEKLQRIRCDYEAEQALLGV